MLDHSQAKVGLYGSYLEKYLNIISQDGYTNCIHLYDLFCGDGVYKDGGVGSPIIALDAIEKCAEQLTIQMPRIELLLNDIDTDSIANLKDALKDRSLPSQVNLTVHNDNYLNLVPIVDAQVGKFRNEKAIIFMDPKGYKEISIIDIGRLLQNKKSELLLFLPIRDMFRIR